MIIKRNLVLKAIRNEPLSAGFFFGVRDQWEKEKSINPLTCKVCVVGGILRTHLGKSRIENQLASDLTDICEDITLHQYDALQETDYLIEDKNYLGALSSYFEHKMEHKKLVTKYVRNDLCKFVKKHFPKQFKVDSVELTSILKNYKL